jgi:hypothetical protein
MQRVKMPCETSSREKPAQAMPVSTADLRRYLNMLIRGLNASGHDCECFQVIGAAGLGSLSARDRLYK